ncbi:MAG: hypothetical protein GY801_11290 [bacterium]|nr:hypothetical protein [bacterium]
MAKDSPQNEPHPPDDQVARKDVIGLLTPTSPHYILKGAKLKGSIAAQTIDQTVHVCYEQVEIENDSEYLRYLFDLLSDLAEACSCVVALGGEAVPFLKDMASTHRNSIAIELLKAVARDTTARIGDRASQVVCPSCLTRYKAHKVWLGVFVDLLPITYYGCRICGQSREFLEGRLVAVLDSRMDTERVQQDGTLRVNWLERRALLDFDEVEIVQAGDEDVERFAVQVGNDTDDFRQSRYREMSCTIVPDCGLSENTLRILQSTFYVNHRKKAKKFSSWQTLAASKDLTFVPDKFFGHKSYLIGTYRHHHLQLATFEKSQGEQSYRGTRLSVSVEKRVTGSPQNVPSLPGKPVSSKDAISLLTPTSPHYILKGAKLKGSIIAHTVDRDVYLCYVQAGIENDSEYLGYLFDLISDLAEAYSAVVAPGGAAVPFLKDMLARNHHESIAIELLKAIARDTTARIGD